MCRNIVRLRHPDRPTTTDECYLAALQYVRKVSGFRAPAVVMGLLPGIAAWGAVGGLVVRGEPVEVEGLLRRRSG